MNKPQATWRKSSYSGDRTACVEIAEDAAALRVRDSKLGERSAVLTFTAAAWSAFLGTATRGQ